MTFFIKSRRERYEVRDDVVTQRGCLRAKCRRKRRLRSGTPAFGQVSNPAEILTQH